MFERFDDVQVPDQWDEIAARSADPSGPAFQPRRPRAVMLVAAAAAVLGIAGVLWVVSSDGDDLATVGTPADTVPDPTIPTTTVAPMTTFPPTTVETTQPPRPTTAPSTFVAETVPPVTSAPPIAGVSSSSPINCGESVTIGHPDGVFEDDPALDQFGPLGAAPVLEIDTGWPEFLNAFRDVTRVPDGTAILLQTNSLEAPAWSLTVVNDENGYTRWRRCGQGKNVVSVYAVGQVLVMAEQLPSTVNADPALSWHAIDTSTGADLGALDVPLDPNTRISFDDHERPARFMLFGAPQPYNERGEPLPGAPDAMLRVLDGMTMTTADVPYPPDYYTGAAYADLLQLVETADAPNGWMLEQLGDQYPTVASVFVDGSWTNDPSVIRSVIPVAAYSSYGIGSEWTGVDPVGETVWTLPGRAAYWMEGPESTSDEGIDLLSVCERYDTTADGGSGCVSPGLVGVDGATGEVLWELPGHRMTAAVGNGYAIVTDGTENVHDGTSAATWLMIATATGEPVEGQSWTFDTFEEDYSMEEDGIWVRQQGGVVLAVNGQHVRVWFPAGLSNGTVNVSL